MPPRPDKSGRGFAAERMSPIAPDPRGISHHRSSYPEYSAIDARPRLRPVGCIVLGSLVLRSKATARRLGHAERASNFRERTGDVVRSRTHLAAGASGLGQVALFAILLASVRAVGIDADQLD